ncbi:MAG TPA: sensor histidine kinase KdpD [Polyangiaceae bacterium]|nr:sensor histidine kinase KdpD [Polyangiaceae bacterium]
MVLARPDPDELLRRVQAEEQRAQRGKLTVFFGAAPGVGKTYAMLEAARAELEQEQRDVVIGIVETHGRQDTLARVAGLAILPRRKVLYRGIEVEEFDLDAALARRPQLLLVDELAHTNAEGSRHPKRWQDVEELLASGIDVFSTMNVQHVESLNDVVAKITSVRVRETVPDSVLEHAHELKLVDLPPDDLLERLRDGKVYLGAQAERAMDNFFKKGNLIALRELALRQTAERVDAQMREYRQEQGIEQTWAINDQLLVAVSPSPYSARLVRAARRMASSLHARWYAVYVESPNARPLPKALAERLAHNLDLADQLGAEVVTLNGEQPTDEILRFARARNITKLIVGKPVLGRWRERFRASLVDRLVRASGDIDVYVTAGDPDPSQPEPSKAAAFDVPSLPSLAAAALGPALATGLCLVVFGRDQLPDVVMIYLLAIMLVSSRAGFGASLFAALLSVGAFDFFFVPPYLTFAVDDFRHATTFLVMAAVAIVISGLTQRIRQQAQAAREREIRTAGLYALSRELAAAQGLDQVAKAAAHEIEKAFRCAVSVFVPSTGNTLARCYASPRIGTPSERDLSVSQWVWANRREAGMGTTTLPGGTTLYLPLMGSAGSVGVLAVTPEEAGRLSDLGQRRQLDAFVAHTALAMERAQLAQDAERARREMEAEQLRSSLLSSVSHDLRTPLAVITGATGTLLQTSAPLDSATSQDLLRTVLEEAERLNRLIRNLLDMTRLESGAVKVTKEWLSLEELVGSALNHLDARLLGRDVKVDLPGNLPLVPGDAVLLEQVLINLVENAAKYSAGAIEIKAVSAPDQVAVEVNDRGPGIPAGEEVQIFDKFHRSSHAGAREGVGLGLTICRAIVAVHGGEIWALNRQGGGASFRFTLPLDKGQPPALPDEPVGPDNVKGQVE